MYIFKTEETVSVLLSIVCYDDICSSLAQLLIAYTKLIRNGVKFGFIIPP